MKNRFIRYSYIFILCVANACGYQPDAINTITFSEVEVADITNSIQVVIALFETVKKRQDIPERDLGFVLVADSIYYRHCIDSKGKLYKDQSCNIESILTTAENVEFQNAIQYLKERNIIGSFFCLPLKSHVMILGTDYNEFEDARFLYYLNGNDSLLLKSPYTALDSKNRLLLLKNKR